MNNPTPLRIDTVLPLAVWIKDKPWNQFWVRWFLAYALLPLALTNLIGDTDKGVNLGFAAWFFGLYFAVLWLMVLYLSMNPGKADIKQLALVSVFTAFVGIIIVLVLQLIPPFNLLYSGTNSEGLIPRLIAFIFGVGIVEEGTKALPLYLFAFRSNRPITPLMFSFIGAVSGLAFGVSEAVGYSYRYANGLLLHQLNVSSYIIVQLLRFISLPLLHACWSAVVGYFIGLAYLHRGRTVARSLVVFGIAVSAVMHGLYDALGGVGSLVIAALTLLVFVSYVRTSNLISRQLASQYNPAPSEIP